MSPKMGSRRDQTVVYFSKDRTQVICGCYVATLEEFEERVKEVHKDSEYAKQYLDFISKVRVYMN